MPELPEVETVRTDLEREVVGRRVGAVTVEGERSVRRHPDPAEFVHRLVGRRIDRVARRGKYLVCGLDSDDALVVHLGMSGQLLRGGPGRGPAPRHTHVVMTLARGGQLRFVDPRTFGEMFVTPAGTDGRIPALAHLGPDPFDVAGSWGRLASMLATRTTKLKALLMDQRFLAGLGNIYSDEILWDARLRWDRPGASLTEREVRSLARAMAKILRKAVEHRGSSLADAQYVDLFGRTGTYQRFHHVYAREGQGCRRCRRPIVRDRFGGRSTFWCPVCQR